jgi:hypothetical protein
VAEPNKAFFMKRFGALSAALTIPLLLLLPFPSWAWEVKIDSAVFSFRYLYASQTGSQGFFGRYDLDTGSTGGDLASLNGWFRKNFVSGTTGVVSSTRFVFFPVLKLSKAMSVYGTYRVGPFNPDNLGVETHLADARWTRLWIQVETPLGRIYYGKRPFRQGCGLEFGSGRTAEELEETARRAEEILQLEAFTGPLTVGAGFYPRRRGSRLYWNPEDHNGTRAAHVLGYVRYTASYMDMGVGGFYLTFNEGPEAQHTAIARASAAPSTTVSTEGWMYFKFSDGRFFFNSEADWYYLTLRYQGSQDGTFFGNPPEITTGGGSRFAPSYIESWRYMSEFGLLAGPTKLSFLLAHMPGPDRRNGILIDRQPFIQEQDKSAYGVYYPYCLLMAKVYESGVNSFRDMSDSNVAAGRLDYMLASNLEVYASLTYARRVSHGYTWGCIGPNTDPKAFGKVDFSRQTAVYVPAPSIPDRDLGWEVDVGVAWKLLEDWRIHCRGAYWNPGRWFNYACVDRSVPNWDKPSSANNFGVNPDRTIDPVLGFELYLDAAL